MPQHGVSGNRPMWGTMDTSEHVRKLTGSSGQAIFNQMRRSDGQIAAVLRAISLPVIRNQYTVEPPSDDAADVEIAEFVEDNLFNRMTMSWRDTLRHVLLMKPHGFMPFEKLYQRSKDDGKIRLKKLDPRLPWSVDRWNYDGDTLKSLEQVGTDGQRYTIPIEKLVVFTENREGDNWEGTSALRSVYGYWLIKNTMLEIAAVKHDRFGVGVPIATEPEGGATEQQRQDMETLLEELHADERGHLRVPHGWEVKLLEMANNQGIDTEGFIDKLDHKIATALLAQFLQLGTTDSGNRALGESFIDFFLMSMQETADYIAEVLSRFVITELVDYNFDVDEYPVLHAGRIKEIDHEALGALVTAGVIKHDIDMENSVREQLGLPEREEDESESDAPNTEPADEPESEPEDEEDDSPEDEQPETEHADRVFADLPDDVAAVVDPYLLEDQLDRSTETVLDAVLRLRETQIERLIIQIAGGRKIRDLNVPAKKEMYDELVRAYREQRRIGREQVREEVGRQRPDLQMADPADGSLLELVLEELSLRVEGAGDKLKAIVGELALDLQKAGYRGDDLRVELERVVREKLGDRTWRDLAASAVNQGWGNGREEELQSVAEDAEYYYRSVILDRNACTICRPKDGMRVTPGTPEFRVPDPECEGGPSRCRCLIVAVMKQESAGA